MSQIMHRRIANILTNCGSENGAVMLSEKSTTPLNWSKLPLPSNDTIEAMRPAEGTKIYSISETNNSEWPTSIAKQLSYRAGSEEIVYEKVCSNFQLAKAFFRLLGKQEMW